MAKKAKPKKYILVSPNMKTSVVHTATSILTPFALIGLGVWMESDAMQWLGFLASTLLVFSWVKRATPLPLTISQARAELDRMESSEQ